MVHDGYGKRVLLKATNGAASIFRTPAHAVNYGAGQAQIDVVVEDIAVEIAASTGKQVRASVLDLICHPYQKKLLVLMPSVSQMTSGTAQQCDNIIARFCPNTPFRVIVIRGSGNNPQLDHDGAIVASALAELGYGNNAPPPSPRPRDI
jgi:hypothetical protein